MCRDSVPVVFRYNDVDRRDISIYTGCEPVMDYVDVPEMDRTESSTKQYIYILYVHVLFMQKATFEGRQVNDVE